MLNKGTRTKGLKRLTSRTQPRPDLLPWHTARLPSTACLLRSPRGDEPPRPGEETRARPRRCEQGEERAAIRRPPAGAEPKAATVGKKQGLRQTPSGTSVTTHPLAACRFPRRSSGISRPGCSARTSGPQPALRLRLLVTQATTPKPRPLALPGLDSEAPPRRWAARPALFPWSRRVF